MSSQIEALISFVKNYDGINDKSKLCKLVVGKFQLVRDRSVYYCDDFAIRFSSSSTEFFSNTVLSLSKVQKFDDRPLLVCNVTPNENFILLANSTMLKKISHTSQELRIDNIRGSFNGSDIERNLDGIANVPDNFTRLFDIHAELGFDENLPRLVEATNDISPSGVKFHIDGSNLQHILSSPMRAKEFMDSTNAIQLKNELDEKVEKFTDEILLAALIENVNVRGRVIEYLIAGEDEHLRDALVDALQNKSEGGLPQFRTANKLGDFTRVFDRFHTETDVKTKIMVLSSNPKAYNLDKMLEFLATERSVFIFYFVGVNPGRDVCTVLISKFQKRLLSGTIKLKHWAGRNSRGVTQFDGNVVGSLILSPEHEIDIAESVSFLNEIIDL